jgi:aarF domain-containing kinase
MRGAVLKLGQILSTGEASIVPPVIRDAMEKARSEADIMPVKQVMKILDKEYGTDWSKRFREINLYPFAAASIGQVHEAILKDGMKVALKIQYTGVADSIDSDLNNFMRLVNLFGGLPRGLFLNELVETTRHELYWETDYLREASMQRQYAERLIPYPKDYYCPKVIADMSTKHLLCTEFIDGIEIDTLTNEPQETRDRAGMLLLQLCFKELFEWKIMQTDPNPANFLYDVKK